MRYFVFDNGLEFLITKSKVYDEKAVVCSCVGDIKDDFYNYVKDFIDDDKIYEFEFNGEIINGSNSQCVLWIAKKRQENGVERV
ncbi:hypothetical protein [uncultured Campylobacter sp.]|uniref:hypothetical protein n=1 Tax=uncultured Campylobacter sp. TaxID=218934 RepID=UPI0026095706|nr:hypothetical protein [uncultured Campylobacter sp.]